MKKKISYKKLKLISGGIVSHEFYDDAKSVIDSKLDSNNKQQVTDILNDMNDSSIEYTDKEAGEKISFEIIKRI